MGASSGLSGAGVEVAPPFRCRLLGLLMRTVLVQGARKRVRRCDVCGFRRRGRRRVRRLVHGHFVAVWWLDGSVH